MGRWMKRVLVCGLLGFAALCGEADASVSLRGWDNIGPAGGTLPLLATDPDDERHVAAWSEEGVYETRDGGTTWRLGGAQPCAYPVDLALRGDSIYVSCQSSGVSSGVTRSRNHGDGWEAFTRFAPSFETSHFAFHPRLAGVAAVHAYDLVKGGHYLAVTRDDGQTWSTAPWTDGYQYTEFMFDPAYDTRLLAVRNSWSNTEIRTLFVDLMWTSFETLGSWTASGTPWTNNANQIQCVAYGAGADSTGVIFVAGNCGIATTRDSGRSWQQRNLPELSSAAAYVSYAKVDASPRVAGRAVANLYSAVFLTEDGGASWRSLTSAGYMNTAIAADGALWTSESDGRVYRSSGAARTATSLVRHDASPNSLEVAGAESEVLFAGGGVGGMRRSPDAGQTWSPLGADGAQITFVRAVAGQPLAMYGGSGRYDQFYEALWFSADAGKSWQAVSMPAFDSGLTQFTPVGAQPGVVYATTSQPALGGFDIVPPPTPLAVMRSEDGGHTWRSINAGVGGKAPMLSASQSDPATAYAATTAGVYRTRDGGNAWKLVWDSAARGAISVPVVDARDPALIYSIASERLWISEDGGDHWRETLIPNYWGSASSTALVHPRDSGRLFLVSSDAAVFESTDRGATWSRATVAVNSSDLALGSPRIASTQTSTMVLGTANHTIVGRDIGKPHPRALGTDLWWNPADPGWGVSIVQHENFQVWAIWFTYDANGKPTWRFVSGGTWTDSNTFTGILAKAQSVPGSYFTSTFDPSRVDVTPVGTAVLRFSDDNTGEATFQLDGITVRQPINRMPFGPVAARQASKADLWWNPLESGWGISLHQQYSTVFATWFLYDDQGAPTWLLMPNARVEPGLVTGDVYRPMGGPGAPYVARNVVVTKAGTASIGEKLDFTIDGVSATRGFVTRLPF